MSINEKNIAARYAVLAEDLAQQGIDIDGIKGRIKAQEQRRLRGDTVIRERGSAYSNSRVLRAMSTSGYQMLRKYIK